MFDVVPATKPAFFEGFWRSTPRAIANGNSFLSAKGQRLALAHVIPRCRGALVGRDVSLTSYNLIDAPMRRTGTPRWSARGTWLDFELFELADPG